jgi:HD-GYP domain-containing protein (c-di-GMP phosphodiesterase class II)
LSAVLTILVFAVAGVYVTLGLLVLQRNSHSFTNRCFSAATAFLAIWVVANYFADMVNPNHERLIFLNRLTIASGIVGGMLLFAFALSFPYHRSRMARAWKVAFIPGGVLAVLAIATPLLVADVTNESWGTNIILGPLYAVLILWGIVCTVALSVNIIRRFRIASSRERVQFGYLWVGVTLFFFSLFFLTGILPYLLGNNELAKLVPFTALLFLVPTSYAILRHNLLDIGWSTVRGAAFTLLLAAVAATLVVLAGEWMNRVFEPLAIDARIGLFVVGLAVLLGFEPLRNAILRVSDRLLRQNTYDPDVLLRQVGEVISTTLDPEAVASIIVDELAREMRLAFASVAFYQGTRPVIICAGPEPPDTDLRDLLTVRSGGRTIVADELERGDPIEVALNVHGARVVVPLLHDDHLLGALILGHKQSGRRFSDRDLRFLGILSAESSVALRNATLFDELSQRVRELSALNQLAGDIGADIELATMLHRALEQAAAVTGAEAGSIMLLDEAGTTLEIAASIGLSNDIVASTRERVGEGISGWVASTLEPLVLVDGADERLKKMTARSEITSSISVPVVFKDELIGVINMSRQETPEAFTTQDLNMITLFAGQLGVAVKNARLYGDLENTFLGTISSLAAAVDAKDPYTFGHSTEVTEYADAIGHAMGLSEDDLQTLHIAATLHDIGKIGVDSALLRKPGALSAEERAEMEHHPSIGADILAPLDFLKDAVPLVLFHHERFGGSGYPSGVSGSAIPLGARIISVADSFNAMVSDRPYRSGLPWEKAVGELRDNSGTQFDPDVVAAFMTVLEGRRVGAPGLRVVPREPKSARIAGSSAG